jgi:hypothetical protein
MNYKMGEKRLMRYVANTYQTTYLQFCLDIQLLHLHEMAITAGEALEGWKLIADDLIDESALEGVKWSVFLSWISNVAVVDFWLVLALLDPIFDSLSGITHEFDGLNIIWIDRNIRDL